MFIDEIGGSFPLVFFLLINLELRYNPFIYWFSHVRMDLVRSKVVILKQVGLWLLVYNILILGRLICTVDASMAAKELGGWSIICWSTKLAGDEQLEDGRFVSNNGWRGNARGAQAHSPGLLREEDPRNVMNFMMHPLREHGECILCLSMFVVRELNVTSVHSKEVQPAVIFLVGFWVDKMEKRRPPPYRNNLCWCLDGVPSLCWLILLLMRSTCVVFCKCRSTCV